MNILAVRFARLGDVALLLPALARLKAALPGCRLTLLTGHRCAPLARLSTALDEVISVDRVAMKEGNPLAAIGPILGLVGDVRRRRFDAVVDFHGLRETGLLTWLSGARERLGLKRSGQSSLQFCYNLPPVVEDKRIHVADMFARVADALAPGAGPFSHDGFRSAISVPQNDREWWQSQFAKEGAVPYVAFFVDAPVKERNWPIEKFAALADALMERCGAHIVALAGPGHTALTDRFLQLVRHPDRVTALSDLSIGRLAACIASAQVFVSNDTGPMHLGSLVGTPTLGLFSVGLPEHFRPLGSAGAFLKANPIDKLEVADVLRQVESMLTTVG